MDINIENNNIYAQKYDHLSANQDLNYFCECLDHNYRSLNHIPANGVNDLAYSNNPIQYLNHNLFKVNHHDYANKDTILPLYDFYNQTFPIEATSFPLNFNPRRAANMRTEDKVKNWISTIPSSIDNNCQIIVNCFPADISYSSSNSDLSQLDLTDFDEILELQARRITRFTNRLYLQESQPFTDNIADDSEQYYDEDGNLIDFDHDEMFIYGNTEMVRSSY